MFEKDLKEKMQRIFDLKKVSFDNPSDSMEQEVLFLDVTFARNSIKDGMAFSRVEGNGRIFVNGDKMPFGYLSKRIKMAGADLNQDLFFSQVETSRKVFQNIVERRFEFVYFWRGEYDPEHGSLTSLNWV